MIMNSIKGIGIDLVNTLITIDPAGIEDVTKHQEHQKDGRASLGKAAHLLSRKAGRFPLSPPESLR